MSTPSILAHPRTVTVRRLPFPVQFPEPLPLSCSWGPEVSFAHPLLCMISPGTWLLSPHAEQDMLSKVRCWASCVLYPEVHSGHPEYSGPSPWPLRKCLYVIKIRATCTTVEHCCPQELSKGPAGGLYHLASCSAAKLSHTAGSKNNPQKDVQGLPSSQSENTFLSLHQRWEPVREQQIRHDWRKQKP